MSSYLFFQVAKLYVERATFLAESRVKMQWMPAQFCYLTERPKS